MKDTNKIHFDNSWYVYRHIREDKNCVFYVGIGKKKNYKRAIGGGRNSVWHRIIEKTKWRAQILAEGLSKQEASKKEQEFISLYGRADLNKGTLCNMTDGGDGIWNCKRSEETKNKLREQKLGSKNPSFGKKQSQDIVDRKNQSLKDSWNAKPEELKKKIIEKRTASIRKLQAKKVEAFDFFTKESLGEFNSIREASIYFNIEKSSGKISLVCSGKRSRVKNFTFKYI